MAEHGKAGQVKQEKTSTSDLANLTQTELQQLAPEYELSLSQLIGNRAMGRLMSQRQEEEEEIPGPRIQHLLSPADVVRLSGIIGNRAVARLMTQRPGEEEEEIPGPRMKLPREGGVQQRGIAEGRSSPAHRATPHSSASLDIGDAVDLDGQGLYGWDRPISAADVATVVNGLMPTVSSEEEIPRIVIFTGHHGTDRGNLVGPEPSFTAEDRATAAQAMAANPGAEIEVIDDPSTYTTKAAMAPIYTTTAYLRILAWCYGKRSYELGNAIKANWWAEPDHLEGFD